MTVTGIDYLTGERGIPVNDLNFVDKGAARPPLFPAVPDGFAAFAAVFCNKYGVASDSLPPVVLTDESLAVVRTYYDRTGGRINRVSDERANKSW